MTQVRGVLEHVLWSDAACDGKQPTAQRLVHTLDLRDVGRMAGANPASSRDNAQVLRAQCREARIGLKALILEGDSAEKLVVSVAIKFLSDVLGQVEILLGVHLGVVDPRHIQASLGAGSDGNFR